MPYRFVCQIPAVTNNLPYGHNSATSDQKCDQSEVKDTNCSAPRFGRSARRRNWDWNRPFASRADDDDGI